MNSLGQYNSRKMEFQSKRKVHPCLDYHIPIFPIFIKQEFLLHHTGEPRLAGLKNISVIGVIGSNKRILVILDNSVLG